MDAQLALAARPVTPAGLVPRNRPNGRLATTLRPLFRSGGRGPHRDILSAARIGAVLGLLVALAACGSVHSGGAEQTPGRNGPPGSGDGVVGSTPTSKPLASGLPSAMQPNRLEPDDRAVDLRAVPWEQAESSERLLTVHFTTTGRRECATLGRVDVSESGTVVTVTVLIGRLPGADCSGAQPQGAAPATVTVTLAQPVGGRTIVDGSVTHT